MNDAVIVEILDGKTGRKEVEESLFFAQLIHLAQIVEQVAVLAIVEHNADVLFFSEKCLEPDNIGVFQLAMDLDFSLDVLLELMLLH